MLVDASDDSAFRDRVVEELRSRLTTDAGRVYWSRSGGERRTEEGKYRYGDKRVLTTATVTNALVNAQSGTTTEVDGTLAVRANGSIAERLDLSAESGDEVQTVASRPRGGRTPTPSVRPIPRGSTTSSPPPATSRGTSRERQAGSRASA